MALSFANAIPGRVKAEVSRSLVGFSSSFPSCTPTNIFFAGQGPHAQALATASRPLAALLHRLACSATAPSGAALPFSLHVRELCPPAPRMAAKQPYPYRAPAAGLTPVLPCVMRLGELDGRTSAPSARPYAVCGKCSRASNYTISFCFFPPSHHSRVSLCSGEHPSPSPLSSHFTSSVLEPIMAPPSKDGLDIIILGGGIAGLTTALALTKYAPKGQVPRIRIFEIRPEPATIGGAVNLTPNALRLLDDLGALPIIRERDYGREIDYLEVFDVYSTRLATSDFSGPDGKGIGNPPYKALRITRGDALKGVLAAVEKQENISLTCGKRTTEIKETEESVTLTFEDGGSATADLLMGCDGIHSVTRLKHIEPERKASYSGLCNAFGFAPVEPDFPVHFECTAINFARRGMLLTSYHNSQKNSVYVGALMQLPELESRDGWKAAGADAKKIRADIMDRFGDAKISSIKPLIEKTEDFYLWPVFTLSKHGKWSTDRVMLLGDAAVS
jgi:salicylate hydroxylase